jgi:hypothetical protein
MFPLTRELLSGIWHPASCIKFKVSSDIAYLESGIEFQVLLASGIWHPVSSWMYLPGIRYLEFGIEFQVLLVSGIWHPVSSWMYLPGIRYLEFGIEFQVLLASGIWHPVSSRGKGVCLLRLGRKNHMVGNNIWS